jgi:hypothetical protein
MIAIAEPKTYVSVIDFSAGVGTSVAWGPSWTVIAVKALDDK